MQQVKHREDGKENFHQTQQNTQTPILIGKNTNRIVESLENNENIDDNEIEEDGNYNKNSEDYNNEIAEDIKEINENHHHQQQKNEGGEAREDDEYSIHSISNNNEEMTNKLRQEIESLKENLTKQENTNYNLLEKNEELSLKVNELNERIQILENNEEEVSFSILLFKNFLY